MWIRGITDEDFVNYKKPSMYIAFPFCDFKCEREAGCPMCHNSQLMREREIEVKPKDIVERYMNNDITKAVVMAGLEPFDSAIELVSLIIEFRKKLEDDIIIYTGYTEEELETGIGVENKMYHFIKTNLSNVIIKYGRYVPNQEPHYDEILGVKLASPNQYARRIN